MSFPPGNVRMDESEPMRENRIERLVSEIGQVIGQAPIETREELRQMASDLLNEETRRLGPQDQRQLKNNAYARPLSGFVMSGFALLHGIVLFWFLPLIGLLLFVPASWF